ncbi:hypothetical protein IF1G_07715 [Cordyceps javanica]|uniref:Uncharacterized protein n=1 Tax=Cordyceps javanica TaxID=43265 RepID=A0A545UWY5_9HYPO|nr:hypothetical protein IF1G_07715 [Cordyceps javanica]
MPKSPGQSSTERYSEHALGPQVAFSYVVCRRLHLHRLTASLPLERMARPAVGTGTGTGYLGFVLILLARYIYPVLCFALSSRKTHPATEVPPSHPPPRLRLRLPSSLPGASDGSTQPANRSQASATKKVEPLQKSMHACAAAFLLALLRTEYINPTRACPHSLLFSPLHQNTKTPKPKSTKLSSLLSTLKITFPIQSQSLRQLSVARTVLVSNPPSKNNTDTF